MDVFAGLPCTDRDLAEVAVGDFAVLLSRSERVAYGEDGAVSANSFVLTSAFPFASQGVQEGHVCVIHRIAPVGANGKPAAREVDDDLPVASAIDGAVTLGRLGYPPGQGAFPAGAGTSGITFFVPTALAQIATAYAEILRRLNMTASAVLVDPTDLRLATAYMVLRGLYLSEYRQSKDDTFKDKAADMGARSDEQMASLMLTYGAQNPRGRRVVSQATTPPGAPEPWCEGERWREREPWTW